MHLWLGGKITPLLLGSPTMKSRQRGPRIIRRPPQGLKPGCCFRGSLTRALKARSSTVVAGGFFFESQIAWSFSNSELTADISVEERPLGPRSGAVMTPFRARGGFSLCGDRDLRG